MGKSEIQTGSNNTVNMCSVGARAHGDVRAYGETLKPNLQGQERLPKRGDAYTEFTVGISFDMPDFLNL